MTALVLTVLVGWLLLAAMTTAAWTLVVRGGLDEDRRRLQGRPRRPGPPAWAAVPRPRVTIR